MDLESRVKVCLITWARRIIRNPHGTAANITRAFCGEFCTELIWASKRNFADSVAPVFPFYSAVFKVWQTYHNMPPKDESDIRREVIWNNPRILSLAENCSKLRWCRWIEAEIWTIGQLCHLTEGRIMGQQEINNKFHIEPTFLEGLSIRNYIPIQWKRSLTTNFDGRDSIYYGMQVTSKSLT